MNIKKIVILSVSIVLLSACSNNNDVTNNTNKEHSKEDSHGHSENKQKEPNENEHGEESGVVKLSKEQMQTAGIQVTKLELQSVNEVVKAPGEVKLNDYQTVKITPRIDAQIIDRHAVLGEKVIKGQPLVTLSSVDMAEVQGKLLVATREWDRVKKLGRKVVAERRYTEARANWTQLMTKVRSYGMTDLEVNSLIKNTSNKRADGTFQLLAPLSGRVIHDHYIIGERIEPGKVLVSITDESVMWVEARLNANQASLISKGNYAEVVLGSDTFPATVSQVHHSLDESTRTLAVRLEVENPTDKLHSGMFVTANISANNKTQALVIPEAAVIRSADGDWQIFIEADEQGEFKAQEIELIKIINGNAVIEGIKPGTVVVTKGAFFVQSELAKSGFSIHNH